MKVAMNCQLLPMANSRQSDSHTIGNMWPKIQKKYYSDLSFL